MMNKLIFGSGFDDRKSGKIYAPSVIVINTDKTMIYDCKNMIIIFTRDGFEGDDPSKGGGGKIQK